MKQSCIARQCLAPVLPHTACCVICGRDGWEKLAIDPALADEASSSLMECSQCWEIVHPFCLNERHPEVTAHNRGKRVGGSFGSFGSLDLYEFLVLFIS